MISWPEPARSDRSITLADGEVSLSEYLSLSPYPPPNLRCASLGVPQHSGGATAREFLQLIE